MSRTRTRLAIIGGGRACRDLLAMMERSPGRLELDVVGVADIDPNAPGMQLARELGVEQVVTDYREFFARKDLDVVLELTGDLEVRDQVFRSIPPDIHFIDHYASRFIWDIYALAEESSEQQRESERRIRNERNRLRQILDSLPYEILVIDKDYQVEAANRTFLEASGLTLENVIGHCCYDLEHQQRPPCEISIDGCPHAETLQAGRSVATVVSYVDKAGKERFASIRAAPIREEDGTILGVVEAVRDITQRVQTEEQLKETRARLNQFIDTAPLFIYMKDERLRFRVINRHALETLGLEEADIIGKNSFAVLPEDVARRFESEERQVLRTGRTVRATGTLPLRDRQMYYNATLFPVRADDRVVGLFGLVEDMTELHESELRLHQKDEQLSEARTHLQKILENSRDLIFSTDPQGKLLSFNNGAAQVLGYSQNEVVGQSVQGLCVDGELFKQPFARALAEGHTDGFELEFKRKDGEKVLCNASLTTIGGPNGRPSEVVGICRDITTRRRLQNDLIRSERLAAIGKMAAGVAHEINNPLAVMEAIAGVIEDVATDEAESLHPSSRDMLAKAIERLRFQIQRCTSITHSLLGFARKPRAGRQKVNIATYLDDSLNLMASELSSAEVEIRRHYAPGIPDVNTDPALAQQIFVNLLKNAIDAIQEKKTDNGRIELRVEQVENRIAISIKDNGVGISKEAQDKIFDLFHTSKPAGKGTGLGLAIAHDLAKQLGGEIRVDSEVGEWTRFSLFLPLEKS